MADADSGTLLQDLPFCGVWAMTTYDACDYGCEYCVTYAQGRARPLVARGEVADRLRRELVRIPRGVTIAAGCLVDNYPGTEADEQVTREALEVLVEDGREALIITKGTTVTRDIDLLLAHPSIDVKVSIITLDEEEAARLEPRAPTPAARLATVRELHDAGVEASVMVLPMVPGVTDVRPIIEWAGGEIPVSIGPMSVMNPVIATSRFGRDFDQLEVGRQYYEEMRSVGPHPNVQWLRPPYADYDPAVTFAGRSCEQTEATGGVGDSSSRAEQVVRHVLAAEVNAIGVLAMEVFSPYVRIYRGRPPARRLADQGRGLPEVAELTARSAGLRRTVVSVDVDGDLVSAVHSIEGTLDEPWDETPPGTRARLSLASAFRFDRYGMIIEVWQEVIELSFDA
ncbi:MAG: radical SAM protein [Acidimicrobiia bacterium]|nr:radical SAM protein [Acidimicrobiia bacterium]